MTSSSSSAGPSSSAPLPESGGAPSRSSSPNKEQESFQEIFIIAMSLIENFRKFSELKSQGDKLAVTIPSPTGSSSSSGSSDIDLTEAEISVDPASTTQGARRGLSNLWGSISSGLNTLAQKTLGVTPFSQLETFRSEDSSYQWIQQATTRASTTIDQLQEIYTQTASSRDPADHLLHTFASSLLAQFNQVIPRALESAQAVDTTYKRNISESSDSAVKCFRTVQDKMKALPFQASLNADAAEMIPGVSQFFTSLARESSPTASASSLSPRVSFTPELATTLATKQKDPSDLNKQLPRETFVSILQETHDQNETPLEGTSEIQEILAPKQLSKDFHRIPYLVLKDGVSPPQELSPSKSQQLALDFGAVTTFVGGPEQLKKISGLLTQTLYTQPTQILADIISGNNIPKLSEKPDGLLEQLQALPTMIGIDPFAMTDEDETVEADKLIKADEQSRIYEMSKTNQGIEVQSKMIFKIFDTEGAVKTSLIVKNSTFIPYTALGADDFFNPKTLETVESEWTFSKLLPEHFAKALFPFF